MHVVKAAFSGWQCVQRDWNPSIYRDAPRKCPYLERVSMRLPGYIWFSRPWRTARLPGAFADMTKPLDGGSVLWVDRLCGASQSAVNSGNDVSQRWWSPGFAGCLSVVVIGLPEHRMTVPPAQCAASLLPGNHALSKRNGCHGTSPALYRIRVRGFVHAGVFRRPGDPPMDRTSAAGRDVTQLVAVTLRGNPASSDGTGRITVGNGCTLAHRTDTPTGMGHQAIRPLQPLPLAQWLGGMAC